MRKNKRTANPKPIWRNQYGRLGAILMQKQKRKAKYAVAAILATWSVMALADDDLPAPPIPKIPTIALSPQAFVPIGWKLEHIAGGDLNNDGLEDIALVIRSDDPKLVIKDPENWGNDTFDSNPRTIIIALAEKGVGYRRVGTNHLLIPRIEDPVIDDPFEDQNLVIAQGLLKLTIGLWVRTGGEASHNNSFTFSYHNGAVRLIGYDEEETNPRAGTRLTTSVNYLTGKMKVDEGSLEHDRVETQWVRLARKPLILFDDVGHGYNFAPTSDYTAPGK